MFVRFGLVLMVNHACNLRCSYCYTGAKFSRAMTPAIGCKSIDRALALLRPGGALELGFFGGEPLLEAELIREFLTYARAATSAAGAGLHLSLTTNGTQLSAAAWEILTMPELDLAISHDGLPGVHDRHRRTADGHGTSGLVLDTMRRLLAAGKEFRVVMVVRPDTLDSLPDGMEFLRAQGVRRVEPSLDLWTRWRRDDGPRLAAAIERCAQIWRAAFPDFSVSWFDEKAGMLSRAPVSETARCGFGEGQIAVAPSGNLYPCERLIGEDSPSNPMRLPGHALEGSDFVFKRKSEARSAEACDVCAVAEMCSTTCRCSNYVRTGSVSQPDGLLCLLNQVCLRETARALKESFVPVQLLRQQEETYARASSP